MTKHKVILRLKRKHYGVHDEPDQRRWRYRHSPERASGGEVFGGKVEDGDGSDSGLQGLDFRPKRNYGGRGTLQCDQWARWWTDDDS
jgi:hypothetical protein